MFSRRPSPQFELSDSELTELDRLLESVVNASAGELDDPPEKLGFRSLRIESGRLGGTGLITTDGVWVSDNIVYPDPGATIYRYLREVAIANVDRIDNIYDSDRIEELIPAAD